MPNSLLLLPIRKGFAETVSNNGKVYKDQVDMRLIHVMNVNEHLLPASLTLTSIASVSDQIKT